MRSDSGRSGVGCEGNSIARRPERLRMGDTTSIATWNCGGLTFTQRELCKDLKYDILLLTETHDTGSLKRSRNFIPAEPAPSTDKFSGVALLLSDRVAKYVSFSGSYGSRIVYAQIRAEPRDLFIVGVYMPHSQRKKPLAADILKQLEDIISQVSTSLCIILLGDLNCKLRRNDSGVTGRWCIHKTHNAEGKKLADFLRRNRLVAISTFFQSRRGKSNATYLAKDPLYKPSQIDYIMISSRWATSIVNSKVKWGISLQRWGRPYDHGLVDCVLRMRIKCGKGGRVALRDYSRLKSDGALRASFDTAVQVNLANSSSNGDDPAESFSTLRQSITDAATSTLPPRIPTRLRKRHVSNRTKSLYQQRQNRFNVMTPEERRAANKAIWSSSRNDYRDYMDSVITEMEIAERKGNMREISRLTKIISGKSAELVMPSKDLSAAPITSSQQLFKSWNEFLTAKFSAPATDQNRNLEQTVSPEDHLDTPELEEALAALQSNRAPGWDGIPIEAYQHSAAAKNELFRIVIMIWEGETVPAPMVRGIFIMFYKKGERDKFSNYRAICLLCHAYKLLSAVIARRLHVQLEPILPDSQAGFRPARGTRDNVCILRWTVGMLIRESREAVVTFIDYTAAFDTQSQKFLDEALGCAGVSIKIRRIVQAIFWAASGCVRIRNPDGTEQLSDPFDIARGVLQGDIFSPAGFIVGLWKIFQKHDIPGAGVTVGDYPHQVEVSSLEYADDAGLLDEDELAASTRVTAIAIGSRTDAAMEISKPKTKALHIHRRIKVSDTSEQEIVSLKLKHRCEDCDRTFPNQRGLSIHRSRWCTQGRKIRSRKGTLADKAVQLEKRKQAEHQRGHVSIEGEDIENVYNFVYLGNLTQGDGDDTADVTHRMNMAQARFSSLTPVWKDHRLPKSMKLRLYKASVCSTLTHACEAWELSTRVIKKTNGFNSRCLHMITGRSYRNTATTPHFNLVKAIRRRRLRYLGHIMRMDNSRLVKRCLIAYTRGGVAPPAGSLLMDCEHMTLDEIERAAQDRDGWRQKVAAL